MSRVTAKCKQSADAHHQTNTYMEPLLPASYEKTLTAPCKDTNSCFVKEIINITEVISVYPLV